MTDGAGADLGPWFGTGADRGLALVFVLTGVIGLVATLLALRSRSYRRLSRSFAGLRHRGRRQPARGPRRPELTVHPFWGNIPRTAFLRWPSDRCRDSGASSASATPPEEREPRP